MQARETVSEFEKEGLRLSNHISFGANRVRNEYLSSRVVNNDDEEQVN